MNTDDRVLEVLQKTLSKIEELNTRLGHIEHELDSLDHAQSHMDHYVHKIEVAAQNNNIM